MNPFFFINSDFIMNNTELQIAAILETVSLFSGHFVIKGSLILEIDDRINFLEHKLAYLNTAKRINKETEGISVEVFKVVNIAIQENILLVISAINDLELLQSQSKALLDDGLAPFHIGKEFRYKPYPKKDTKKAYLHSVCTFCGQNPKLYYEGEEIPTGYICDTCQHDKKSRDSFINSRPKNEITSLICSDELHEDQFKGFKFMDIGVIGKSTTKKSTSRFRCESNSSDEE